MDTLIEYKYEKSVVIYKQGYMDHALYLEQIPD